MRWKFGEDYTPVCVTTEVGSGYDTVGALVILEDGTNWYSGYKMQFDQTIDKSHFTNPTAW